MSREIQKLRNGMAYQQKLLLSFDKRISDGAEKLDSLEHEQLRLSSLVAGVAQNHAELNQAVDSLNDSVKELRIFSETSAKESEIRHGDAIAMHNQLAELLGKIQMRTLGNREALTSHAAGEPMLYKVIAGLLVMLGGAVPVLLYATWPMVKKAVQVLE